MAFRYVAPQALTFVLLGSLAPGFAERTSAAPRAPIWNVRLLSLRNMLRSSCFFSGRALACGGNPLSNHGTAARQAAFHCARGELECSRDLFDRELLPVKHLEHAAERRS